MPPARGLPAIADAVAARVDSIEHCSFMTTEGVDDRPDLIEAIAAAGITVSLTLGVRPGAELRPRIAARLAALSALFQKMRLAGIPLVCTSDAGIGPGKPHDILPHGAPMMTDRVGSSTIDALRAVTSLPARLCGVNDRKGRLTPGFDADILAVGGDPLTDPAALLDVRRRLPPGPPRALTPCGDPEQARAGLRLLQHLLLPHILFGCRGTVFSLSRWAHPHRDR